MNKLFSIIEISRPVNVLITCAVVSVSILICSSSSFLTINILLAILSAALVTGAGNVINDIYDIEIDRINKPNRPLPSGRISEIEAIVLFVLFSFFSLIIAYFISIPALVLVLITLVILFLYSFLIKAIPLAGNAIVALCTGLAFIFGGVVTQNVGTAIIPAIFAFQINLVREILKDIEDIKGDTKYNMKTFPIKFGLTKTKVLANGFTILLIFTTFYPFIARLYKIEYFFTVLFFVNLPLIFFLKEFNKTNFINLLPKLSLLLKLVMVTGLISIYVGLV